MNEEQIKDLKSEMNSNTMAIVGVVIITGIVLAGYISSKIK